VVKVEPAPATVMLPVPTVLILFAVGEIAPPLFPVSVFKAPVAARVTNPVPSTANEEESKLESPIFVASAAAMA